MPTRMQFAGKRTGRDLRGDLQIKSWKKNHCKHEFFNRLSNSVVYSRMRNEKIQKFLFLIIFFFFNFYWTTFLQARFPTNCIQLSTRRNFLENSIPVYADILGNKLSFTIHFFMLQLCSWGALIAQQPLASF